MPIRLAMLRLHIAVAATVIPDASKVFSLRHLLSWFTPRQPSRWYAGIDEAQITTLIRRRLQHPWRMRGRRCLREGLLCFYFLRLTSVPAILHFGVFKNPDSRELAHCWITVGDRCVTPPPRDAYVLMMTHPAINDPSTECPSPRMAG